MPFAALAAALLSVVVVVIAFRRLDVARHIATGMEQANTGIGAMFDSTLDDAEKEVRIRKAGLGLLGKLVLTLWWTAVCVLIAAIPLTLAHLTGVATAAEVLAVMFDWRFIVGVTLAAIPAVAIMKRRGDRANATYSRADQALHRFAFSGTGFQQRLADWDRRAFPGRIEAVEDRAPIFIAGLPRAGTTVLLNALHDLPQVATHRYRDMPFVTAPLLWDHVSRPFRLSSETRQRAHGDGIYVGFDSPEAFEEVLWKMFWPEKYNPERIALWQSEDGNEDAEAFFREHFRKIVALRTEGAGRYVSKNNGNIGRLALLPDMFPDSRIVVPVRDPLEHAASLQRQHENFLRQQDDDPFVERYMSDIGHYEFGHLHRPFAFDGFAPDSLDPSQPDYWLHYWIAAYSDVLQKVDRLDIVDSDHLSRHAARDIVAICLRIGLEPGEANLAHHFRPIAPRADRDSYSPGLRARASEVHEQLQAQAIRG
ncbi:sulfotransferase family protein [Aliiruegeria haliotis]|uniref:Sulfotransferase family protein n=1 Tax=Aliiruegeria haliotis TaxID=1280846 RepID=A0A2T0RRG4_9RHOB|nr:sulfotransferase [Aliiruegeria haliotis]PRY23789.1 sulfotransferase family protein [Aliiruegeria haliotis]